MLVNVHYGNVKNSIYTHLIHEIVEFAMNSLKISEEDFEIEIFLDDISDGANGMIIDDIPNKLFTILVQDDRNISQILMTIVHEVIHVKQYIRDNLAEVPDTFFKTIPYLERWWEVEAYEKTENIIKSFISHIENRS